MSMLAQAKAPVSRLAHYRLLSPAIASVRVSPLCLGTMQYGGKWDAMLGAVSKEDAFKMMDTFYSLGGNFIDTANLYQEGESERWIGEWMKKCNNRDEIVLATKFTSSTEPTGTHPNKINHAGNSRKSLVTSVKRSLALLQTDYIDLLYVHWWDYTTTVPELMNNLNYLVADGTVLYLGASDMPAWVVAACNTYAKDHGLAQFAVYQGLWNATTRDFERDIIPMAKAFDLSLAPWGAIGQGKYKPKEEGSRPNHAIARTPADEKAGEILGNIAKELNSSIAQIALAYVMHKYPRTFPIVGCRTPAQLEDNIKALDVKLTPEHMKLIETCNETYLSGFPHNFIGDSIKTNSMLRRSGLVDEN